MINQIINFSIKNKLIVILFTATIAAYGIYAVSQIPVGAVPDITNNQVQVITTSGNLSTQDVEQFLTYPVELEMSNLPGVKEIRSISKFGLSVVTIVFDDNMGTYLPRQLIAEKIKTASANIPEGFGTPEMGPISTGLGEIYQYILDVKEGYKDKYTPMELRTIQDWVVKRQLSGIPGVVEVNTWGGYLKQYEISINPQRLKNFDITLIEVYDAVTRNNSLAGGAYIEKQNLSYFIRGDGMVKSIDEIGAIVVKNSDDKPILVRDIAEIQFGHANRFGAITANGEGEKVLGQIMMLKNANSKQVISDVKTRVAEVQKSLPEGIFINPILERSELIAKTSFTIAENLLLGCLIVIFIVILLLGNIRSALVIASIIPLALLFTISLMYIFGIDANLMSLGALDFGIIIDGAVIIVEFIALRITAAGVEFNKAGKEQRMVLIDRITYEGASKMINSAIFGQVIILIVLIPIFVLSGVEGKMFRPMALSFSFAILGAMILGLTWVPVASAMFLRPLKQNKKSISKWLMNLAYNSYTPVIKLAYNYKKVVFGMAFASLILTGYLFTKIGGEFVPTLDEGDFVIQPVFKTGTSLTKTIELTTKIETILKENFPEVDQIVSRIGAAEVPTDPMSMEEVDVIIKLRPKGEWVSASTKEELANRFKEALSVIPGIEYEFTQPIEMRFNELITGVRADIAVKIFGENLDYLNQKAIEIKQLIEDVPGAADVIMEKTAGLPQMIVDYKREKLAYYGLSTEELNTQLSMAFGGAVAGKIFEGEKRFDMVVRFQKEFRTDIENIRQLNVALPNGTQIPLEQLASIEYTTGPARISRDNTHRRVVVSINVRNRDLESVVKDIQAKIEDNVQLQPGNYITYGGQFENLQNATKRLKLAVPIALLLIFIFLHFAFKSFKDAVLIFTAVPLSAVGGVFFLWLRGMPFSVSAGIGFIALFGVAVLNGIVLIEHLKELKKEGLTDIRELVMRATHERLRPVLLTAAAAALGFLPMAISTSAGAEVQRPLATVVIGGLITSTLLTMIALPLLYAVLNNVTGIQLFPPKFKRTLILILIPLLAFGGLQANAQEQNRNITLEQAIEIAVANNKELNAYFLMTEQSKALIPTAYSIDPTNIFYDYDQNNMAENGYPLNVFGIEQSFKFPTVYTSQRKVNTLYSSISETKYRVHKNKLSRRVAQNYLTIQYLLNKQFYYEKLDSIYSGFLKAVKTNFELGGISQLEKLNAEANNQKIALKNRQLEYDLQIALNELKSLLQTDTTFIVPYQPLQPLAVKSDTTVHPEIVLGKQFVDLENSRLKAEKNKFLPDINLAYYNGKNSYQNAKNYNGYTVGLGIPLFFGEKKSRVNAAKISIQVAMEQERNLQIAYKKKRDELNQQLKKYTESLEYYNNFGEKLYTEIIYSAQKSYDSGVIDIYKYLQSMETATTIKLEYLQNLWESNKIVLEINYFTL
ncbi:MAG: CusA/CzcA family heavy metal efflux RND transporter [Draconibacterium sp.]|nr:CusA/CzcA family heavy metal efflux RND transporter [Draconibacterium sp.]